MKNKKEKQKDLDQLREQLEANKNIFLAGYEKMKVEQDFELRKAVRGAGGHYKVIKNRIAEKAAEGVESGGLLKELKGMCAIAYTSGDPVALAKALTVYAKANPAFTFKAGMVEGRVVDVTGINQLATLPSKEEIFCEAAVGDQCSCAATGDGDERGRPQPGGGGRSGRQGKQVSGLGIFERVKETTWQTSMRLRNRFKG